MLEDSESEKEGLGWHSLLRCSKRQSAKESCWGIKYSAKAIPFSSDDSKLMASYKFGIDIVWTYIRLMESTIENYTIEQAFCETDVCPGRRRLHEHSK